MTSVGRKMKTLKPPPLLRLCRFFPQMSAFSSLGYIPKSRISGSYVTQYSISLSEGLADVSIEAAHLYVFFAMYEGSNFPLVSPTLVFIEL